jgi:hypothetical protein
MNFLLSCNRCPRREAFRFSPGLVRKTFIEAVLRRAVDTHLKEVFHAGREVLQEAYSFLRAQTKHGLFSIPNFLYQERKERKPDRSQVNQLLVILMNPFYTNPCVNTVYIECEL